MVLGQELKTAEEVKKSQIAVVLFATVAMGLVSWELEAAISHGFNPFQLALNDQIDGAAKPSAPAIKSGMPRPITSSARSFGFD